MTWQPLKSRTTFSLLKSCIRPEELIKKCKTEGYTSLAITEIGNLFSCVRIYKLCKENKIKPIIGCDFYINDGDCVSTLTVLAKNKGGWKALIKAISEANKPENFIKEKKVAALPLTKLAELLKGECIVYSGSINSYLGKKLFLIYGSAIQCRSYEDVKKLVRPDWEQFFANCIDCYKHLFKENFYLEVQPIYDSIEACQILNKLVRWAGKKFNVKVIGTCNPLYLNKEDAEDQRILLCSKEQATLNNIQTKLIENQDFESLIYFRGSQSYFPSKTEVESFFTTEELQNTQDIADLCESYEILNPPKFPKFECPRELFPDAYLKELCNEGWKNKVLNKVPKEKHKEYLDRVRMEMEVITEFSLSPYFLLMQDIVSWTKKKGWLVGESRGSVGGSLISHLSDVTHLDPIEHGLLFERFINKGRLSKERISLPDIDTDFPVNKREFVIEYIKQKYGRDRVAQMATFGRLQGRSALKDVLRAKERCSYDEMNKITEAIPDESKIADDLQEMKEHGEEPSIILWALQNIPNKLKTWCILNKDGTLEGDYAKDFAQAMRLEGLKRQQGKHASGIVIADEPIENFCPCVYDNSNGEIAVGVDMQSAEDLGAVKADILGSAALDHMMDAMEIINTGDYQDG